MICTVLFDYAGTLAHISPSRESMLTQYLLAMTKEDFGKDIIARAFKKTDGELFYSSVNIITAAAKDNFYNQYNERLFENLGLVSMKGHGHEFRDHYYSVQKKWTLKDEVIPTLVDLERQNITMGVISNFDSSLRAILKENGIDMFFDFAAISQEVGLEKPNIEFYDHVVRKYDIDPGDTLYVGNDYELDYRPATEVGFKCLLYDEQKYYKNLQVRKITNLKEILHYT